MLRLALALFAVQAGFHGFTASLPLALARGGVPDPEIGLIVGTAALAQVPAAFVMGALIDRFGGRRVFVLAAVSYLLGAAILALPGVQPGGAVWPFLLARVFQGIGLAASLPSALSLVPRLISRDRQGFGLAFMGSAHNLTLTLLPPLSLIVLDAASLRGVAAVVFGIVVLGLSLESLRSERSLLPAPAASGTMTLAPRRFGLALRRSWLRPIAIVALYVLHWGVITAYLPQRAEAAGADIGLFFVADGVAILALRIPSGWLADRTRPILLVIAGLAATAVAVGLLVLPPTTPLLTIAGALTGASGGVLITPLLVELSRRSGDADRGSAFSMFQAALATALVLGSIGASPIVAAGGFEAAILASLVGLGLAGVIALGDADLRPPRHGSVGTT